MIPAEPGRWWVVHPEPPYTRDTIHAVVAWDIGGNPMIVTPLREQLHAAGTPNLVAAYLCDIGDYVVVESPEDTPDTDYDCLGNPRDYLISDITHQIAHARQSDPD